jgi:hypothetical protein
MNLQLIIKFLISAGVITAASEVAKRNVSMGALLCALPLTSLLVIIWTWLETGDQARVASLNWSILAYTIPSFVLFLLFPLGLRLGLNFWASLVVACLLTALTYRLCQPWLDRVG